MPISRLSVEIDTENCASFLVPTGISTPYDCVSSLTIDGGDVKHVLSETELGLTACVIVPNGPRTVLTYDISTTPKEAQYPQMAFVPRQTRYTAAATDLANASRKIAQDAGGGLDGIKALVAESEARLAYAHPDHKFNDGTDAVPYLSCGLTPGSCVDINTYLVASLRAAGYEAAYFYGYFFPQERGGMTDDGHCWVATRHAGEILEWDIAHHIKAGLGPTHPGLNPRPGKRIAMTHSMGHRYSIAHPDDDQTDLEFKILGEPTGLSESGDIIHPKLTARLTPWD